MPDPTPFSSLYPILDDRFETRESLEPAIAALARAGCRLVQLRAKRLGTRVFLEWADIAAAACRRHGIGLIVNDRADVARLAGARGVHLGQEDLAAEDARRLLGEDAIVGLSSHSEAQALAAAELPVDYVAIGPVFATATKEAAGEPLGFAGVGKVRAAVTKPLVAIGGITLDTAPELLAAGVDGLAVISALRLRRGKSPRDAAGGMEGAPDAELEATARRWLALGEGLKSETTTHDDTREDRE